MDTPRRGNDTTEIAELAERVRTIITPLARQLRQHANDGLTPTLLSAIGTISRRGPITLGDLAAQERVSPPMITKVVASLEAQGLVERTSDQADRRVSRVALTPAGEAWLREARARRNQWLARRLETLSPQDIELLGEALPVIERMLAPEG
ncbi:MAG: MarR family winged helix-turn-helix transcriptional regulator [Acidimicrobiales bacterium]